MCVFVPLTVSSKSALERLTQRTLPTAVQDAYLARTQRFANAHSKTARAVCLRLKDHNQTKEGTC